MNIHITITLLFIEFYLCYGDAASSINKVYNSSMEVFLGRNEKQIKAALETFFFTDEKGKYKDNKTL